MSMILMVDLQAWYAQPVPVRSCLWQNLMINFLLLWGAQLHVCELICRFGVCRVVTGRPTRTRACASTRCQEQRAGGTPHMMFSTTVTRPV